MIVFSNAFLPETEEEIITVIRSRQEKTSKPFGEKTARGIWVPYPIEACECCSAVRMPSSKWAWTLYNHCRTAHHVRMLAEKTQRLANRTTKRYEHAMERLAREDFDTFQRRKAKGEERLRENAMAEFDSLGATMDERVAEKGRLKDEARLAWQQASVFSNRYSTLADAYIRRYGENPF